MADIITEANVTSYVRSMLSEASASFWTDAEITLYIKIGMVHAQSRFHTLLYKKKKTYEAMTIVAGTATYDPPTDYHMIHHISEYDTGDHLRYIDDHEYINYAEWSDGSPVAWMWNDDKIQLIPTPGTSSSTSHYVWYTPQLSSITDFPEIIRPWVAVNAVISARTKDENVTPDLIAFQKHCEENVLLDLTFDQLGEPTVMGDRHLQDDYA